MFEFRERPKPSVVVGVVVDLAGGPKAVAERFGITPSGVSLWARRGRVPVQYIAGLSDMAGLSNGVELLAGVASKAGAPQ